MGVLTVVLYWITVRSGVNAFPDSRAEGETHEPPASSSSSQQSCFHGSQLQGSTAYQVRADPGAAQCFG